MVVEFGRRSNVVDVILVQSLVWGKGQARPNDGGWIEWGDEEGEDGRRDIVDEMTVRQVAAGKIEKMTTLSGFYKSAYMERLPREFRPERLGLIVVLYHAGRLPLEIYPCWAVILDSFFEVCGNLCTVGFGWVFAF